MGSRHPAVDVDLYSTEVIEDSREAFARIRDAGPVVDLTARELQIALLVTDGRTTRETAAALFLSPKTVEYHLRNAYTKLGISSRAELADHLRRT